MFLKKILLSQNNFLFKTNITRSCGHELYSAEVMDDKIHRLAHGRGSWTL